MNFDRQALTQRRASAERYHKNLSAEAASYLEDRGITQALQVKYLLGVCDDILPGRLSIPYLRPEGVIWFNFRALNGDKPKYKSWGSKHLYNTAALDIADQTGEIAIAEGELDAIVANDLCDVPCVGIPGATQWTGNRHWHELFAGYQRVWVLGDPDEAGEGLANQILEDLPAARLVKLPGDVTETWLKGSSVKEFMT